jgi:hypothetical protein
MITIQKAVQNCLEKDEEATTALRNSYMNRRAYAARIQKTVEASCIKKVGIASIVTTLSRLEKVVATSSPLVQEVTILNLTAKTPLSEIIFAKTPSLLSRISSLYKKIQTKGDDFLTMTLSTTEVTIICSERLQKKILTHLEEHPLRIETELASVGLSLDPLYYDRPNITFSLLRRIAQKRIVLAETITTHTEIIFVFKARDVSEMLQLFTKTK